VHLISPSDHKSLCCGALVIGDLMRGLERAVIFQISRDGIGAEGVPADPGLDASGGRPALNYPVGRPAATSLSW
jgi:hypothetical protein